MLLSLCLCSSCYCGYQSVNIKTVIGWSCLRPKGTTFTQQHLNGSLVKTLHIVVFFIKVLCFFLIFFFLNIKITDPQRHLAGFGSTSNSAHFSTAAALSFIYCCYYFGCQADATKSVSLLNQQKSRINLLTIF